ncbi:MAG: hypothetical protein U9R13_01665 [Campylobacterota bacterium]|nr:hypothetical protein [Campylobacterota bacterium]
MEKLKLILASGLVSLVLVGCASDQPSFDPNKKGIVVIAGNVYIVPLEASHSLEPFKSDTDKGVIKGRQAGLDCRKGDIVWIALDVQKEVQEAKLDGDVNRAASIILEAPRKRKIGCAHPLSREEYEDYRKKQKQ